MRIKWAPSERVTLLAAVFDGDPAGRGQADPQRRNDNGVTFRVTDAPLVFQEAQIAFGGDAAGPPGTLRLGAFEHFGRFDDLRVGIDGLSLADPTGVGVARRRSGDGGVYGVLDAQLYRVPGEDATKGVAVFARATLTPRDLNLIDLYLDGGATATGLVPGRPNDAFGLAAAFMRISGAAASLDRAARVFTGVATPVRDYELVVEGTYMAQIVPGLSVQPDIQVIVHPGGRVVNARAPGSTRAIADALVVGVRTTINY